MRLKKSYEWHDNVTKERIIEHFKRLPSAQPEPCVDTIDALNESIKHFDDMADECRRNANIERNDYMDMRDDAAEYRQLSIWLNELKWLRERFQSQPERPKGKWIIEDNPGTGWYRVTCSECGDDVTSTAPCIGFYPNAKVTWDYCPNCGADMRGDSNADVKS